MTAMSARNTIVAIVVLFTAAWSAAGSPRQGTPETDRRIAALIAALRDEDGSVRRSAREALVSVGGAAIAGVADALDSPASDIRWQAAWILGHIDDPRVVAPLLRALEHGDAMVRVESGVGLARIGGGARSDAVVDGAARVLGIPNAAGREDATWVLGQVKSPKGIAPLVAALTDPEAGWMAAASLGVLAAPGATMPLAGALGSSSTRTRRAAAWALTKPSAPAGIPALQRALTDRDEEVRYWAAEALRSAGTVDAMRALSSAKSTRWDREARRCAPARSSAVIASGALALNGRRHAIYPEVLDGRPDVPSPLTAADGSELAVAVTGTGRYAIYPVTLKADDRQCRADGDDFPTLARTGLHAEIELDRVRTITGRSISEITELARPGRLSDAGFLGATEDIVSVLKADNRTVAALGLTHPDLARPLLHVWNMMRLDLRSGRWNMADHQWQAVASVFSRGRTVELAAGDTNGTQESVFADGIEGSFWIEARRNLDDSERDFLRQRYARLDPGQMDAFVRSLTRIRTGEIEPYYVMWYGFYEGLTSWRTDPIAIALVFGLRTLEEIESALPGRLYELMTSRFAADH
jgi:HEAT repeat protein